MSLLPYQSHLVPGTYAVVQCPVCDFVHERTDIGTRYCEDIHVVINGRVHPVEQPTMATALPPHLHRICKRCGYQWLEETAQAELDRESARLRGPS